MFAYQLDILAGGAVDYPRLPFVAADEPFGLSYLVTYILNGKVKVRSVEACGHGIRLTQVKHIYDISLYGCRSGSRERREYRADGQRLRKVGYIKVRGAEILPPLRNAVRLVNGYHAYLYLP